MNYQPYLDFDGESARERPTSGYWPVLAALCGATLAASWMLAAAVTAPVALVLSAIRRSTGDSGNGER